jgi:hypothetical protein
MIVVWFNIENVYVISPCIQFMGHLRPAKMLGAPYGEIYNFSEIEENLMHN